ncbi:MAG: MFS transporter [Burkholderiales bacterium]
MNHTLVLLSVTGAVTGMATRAVEPMLPALSTEFGVSVPVAAYIITVFALAYAVGQCIFGPLGDRFGKLLVSTITLALSSLVLLGCATATGLVPLALWRATAGVVTSASFVLGMAFIGDTVPMAQRQTAVAHYVIGNVLGHAFGPLVAGLVADAFGWRATFALHGLTYGLMALAYIALTRKLWRSERRTPGSINPIKRYAEVWKIYEARKVSLTAAVEAFFFFGAFAFVGPLLKERFDLPLTLIGLSLAGFGLGGLMFNMSIRFFVRWNNPGAQTFAGGLLCGAMYIAIALLPVWQMSALCMLGVGFGFYMMHNILQIRGTEAAPQSRGVGLALFGISWTSGQGLGVFAMGAGVSVFGFAPMIALFGLGFALLGLWMRSNYHRSA